MKKFIICCVLAAVSVLFSTTLTSCEKLSGGFTKSDSTIVAKMIADAIMPAFDNADQFTRYAIAEGDYQEFVSIVRTLEPITISSVASNVVKEYHYVDYNGFLREYKKNKPMYDTFDQETKRAGLGNDNIDPPTLEEKVVNKLEPSPDTIKVK